MSSTDDSDQYELARWEDDGGAVDTRETDVAATTAPVLIAAESFNDAGGA